MLLPGSSEASKTAWSLQALSQQVRTLFGLDLSHYPEPTVQRLADTVRNACTDSAMRERIIAACSIGETTFLRHFEQFALLRRLSSTLPSCQNGLPVAVWSAGCATGEEAYSLAATLSALSVAGVHVLGTDLNAASIAFARCGRYRPWSLRGLNPADPQLAGWLTVKGENVEVHEHVRRSVEFAASNLAADPYPIGLDVIFCRNVLLYFHPDEAAAVLERFAASLQIGGLLFLGPCDPMPQGKSWRIEEYGGVHCFRRILAQATEEAVSWRAPYPQPAQTVPAERPSYGKLLELARGFASQRAFSAAIAALEQVCQESALAAEAHILLSLVAEEAGDRELALGAARRACFLLPEDPAAHCFMAQNLLAVGELVQAARHFTIAAARLAALPFGTDTLPYGEGLTANQLKRIIDGHLESLRRQHIY